MRNGPAAARGVVPAARPVAVRFDSGPFAEEQPSGGGARKPRRVLQGSLLLGLVGITAALVVTVPDKSAPGGGADSATRVEADHPTATAELLGSDRSLGVSGTLADAGALAGPAESYFQQPDPGGSLSISYRHLSGVVEPVIGADGTVAAGWVEPTLPPEDEWIDAGNGVPVPDLLLRIRFCESTNDYTAVNRASSARGAYQFLAKSWADYGFAERFGVNEAHLATPAQQDQAALDLLQSRGTEPWTASRGCWSDPDIAPNYATARRVPRTTTTEAPTSTTDSTTGTTADDTTTTDAPSTTATTAADPTTTEAPTTSVDASSTTVATTVATTE